MNATKKKRTGGLKRKQQTLLDTVEESLLLLVGLVNVDDLATSKKLHHKVGSHKRADTKLHKSTTIERKKRKKKSEKQKRGKEREEGRRSKLIGSHNSTKPVEGIRAICHVDTIKRDLAADKEDEQSHDCVDHLFLEGNLQKTNKRKKVNDT